MSTPSPDATGTVPSSSSTKGKDKTTTTRIPTGGKAAGSATAPTGGTLKTGEAYAASNEGKKKAAAAKKSPKSSKDKEEKAKPLTAEEERAIKEKGELLGRTLTKFTNDFKKKFDTNVGVVTTVLAVDFAAPANKITDETKCFVCDEKLGGGVCSQVKRVVLPGASAHEAVFSHPTCFACTCPTSAAEGDDDGCCGNACEVVAQPGAQHNEKGKEAIHIVHIHAGLPVCLLHISDQHLDVPAFDPKTQTKALRNFMSLWGFAKVKTQLTNEACAAEADRIPLAVGMMNGVDEKSMRTKMTESNWDVRLDWCDKNRGLFGIVCDSKAKEGMPDDINKLLANGIRADPILSKEAFVVRAATTDSLIPCFPDGCNAQKNIMTDFGQYVLIPKDSEKMSANRQLQCFAGEKRTRASEKRANSLQSVHGIVFFADTDADKGGISVLICPEQWAPKKDSDVKNIFSEKMDEITPRAPNFGLFSKDHPFTGLPVPIPAKAGEAVIFRNARPFSLRAGSTNVVGMVIGATDMIPKKQTWIHRALAIENGVLPKKDSNRSGVKYPAKTDSPFTDDSPCDWAGYFSPIKEVHTFAREVFGTDYLDPLAWPAEYRPKARTFPVTSPKAGMAPAKSASSISNKDEEDMQAIVEEENAEREEDETVPPVPPTKTKAKKPVAAAAAAAPKAKPAAAAAAVPAKKKAKEPEPEPEPEEEADDKEEDAEQLEIEEEEEPAAAAKPKAKKTPSKSKKAATLARKKESLMNPSSDKTEREEGDTTMRAIEELEMREGFFEQEDVDDVAAGFSAFVRKKGGEDKLVFTVVDAGFGVNEEDPPLRGLTTVFSRGTSLKAFALKTSNETLEAIKEQVDELSQKERQMLRVAGKDTVPGKALRLYGAPLHWNKLHTEPEPETPAHVQTIMDWLNAYRQPEGTPAINQCLFMSLSRKADFIKEMHRTEDIQDGSMLHLVFLGNEERTLRFRSTRPAEGKEKGLGLICLDLNVISGMCISLSPEFCDDEAGMTYEVLRLPKADKKDTYEPDCEPLCVMAFYACAPVSLRAAGKSKNGSKYQRTKPKPKKAKTESASAAKVPTVVGVAMTKQTPVLGGKTHEETLADFRAFLQEHKAVINDRKNTKTFAVQVLATQKVAKESEKTKSTGAKLGDFQRCFAALHKAVTGKDWDAGAPPKAADEEDDDEDIDLGFEPMDLDDDEPEVEAPKKAKVVEPPKPKTVASLPKPKATAAKPPAKKKAAEEDDMQTKVPSSPVEPGSLFEVPEQTRKHVVTASGDVARRSARPKSGPVKTKAEIIAEEQEEMAKKQWLASERARAKKGLPKQSFASYKAQIIMGATKGKGANKDTYIGGGDDKKKRARADSDDDDDDDDDDVHFESSSDDGSDAGADSDDEAHDVDEGHVDLGANLAKYMETLDALFSANQKKLDGPKKDKKLVAIYEKAEELKDKCEDHDNLTAEQLQEFKEAVRALGLALGVEVLASDEDEGEGEGEGDEEDEGEVVVEKKKKAKAPVDLAGATIVKQGWNAEMDPEGIVSARFITTALNMLQGFLAKEVDESAEVIALLDSTIKLLNTPPSVGLRLKDMEEFERLAKRFAKHMDKASKAAAASAPVNAFQNKAKMTGALVQQQIAFAAKTAKVVATNKALATAPVPEKDKEEEEEQEQEQPAAEPMDVDADEPAAAAAAEDEEPIVVVDEEAAAAEDDGEAKPMEVEEEQQEPQEDEEEEQPAAAVLDDEEQDEVVPVAKADDAESDTGGSGAEDADDVEEDLLNQREDEDEEDAAYRQIAEAAAAAEEEEEEQLEGSAGEATKDRVPAARPEQEEELVDENPSPSVAAAQSPSKGQKRERKDEEEEEDDELEVEVEEAVVAPSPSKKQTPLAAKGAAASLPKPLIAAVVQGKRIFGVYESEEEARTAVSRQFSPKAGETIDKYCVFRPLPAHWKAYLTHKLAKEPIVENLKGVLASELWPENKK